MCSGFNYLSVLAVGGGSGDLQHFVLAIHWRFGHFVWIMILLIVNTTVFAVTFGLAPTWTDSCNVSSDYLLHWKWNLGLTRCANFWRPDGRVSFGGTHILQVGKKWSTKNLEIWWDVVRKVVGSGHDMAVHQDWEKPFQQCECLFMIFSPLLSNALVYSPQLEVCQLMLNGLTNICAILEKKCSMLPSLLHLTVFPLTSICA